MSVIEISGLSKSYGATSVLRAVDLTVPDGRITAVLGASGSGKTTLLRVIAGFEDADAGQVSIGGQVVDDGRRTVRPQHRAVGYVPQDAALFPHLTVAANIAFGVRRRSSQVDLAALTDLVGLTGYERRYPHQLSGGQQQRVALARALAISPNVVLLDEPFGSLDANLRETVRAEVTAILAATGTTTILVTHDQDEALSIADNIALIEDGAVLAHGTPRELYDHPATPEIATAIGIANLLDGRLVNGHLQYALRASPSNGAHRDRSAECTVMLRPEQIRISAEPQPDRCAATVAGIRYHGHDTLIDLSAVQADTLSITARVTGRTTLRIDQEVWLDAADDAPHVWDHPEPG